MRRSSFQKVDAENASVDVMLSRDVVSQYDKIAAVSDKIDEVVVVADSVGNVATVAANIGVVTAIGTHIDAIVEVNDSVADVHTVAENIVNVNQVASNIGNIDSVANEVIPNIAEILQADTNAATATSMATTATTQAGLANTARVAAEVAQGAAEAKADEANLSMVAADISADLAAASETTATTKANEASASATTASNMATTATSQAAIATTKASEAATSAANASTSATTATTKANAASVSATSASTSATSASASATTATTKASEASASATSASNSATNASSSAATATTKANEASSSATAAHNSELAAAAILDSFDDRYLGAFASNPTVDNDGNALTSGALYFNTTMHNLRVYDAELVDWIALSGVTFAGLQDVNLTSAATGDVLKWNGTDWVNTKAIGLNSLQLLGGTGTQGTMTWNADEETVDVVQNGAVLQLGQETQVHVRNNSGSSIANGKVVMATGALGSSDRITASLYDGTSDVKYVLGVATETIADGDDGKVTSFGKIRGINTSAWNEGDVLYATAAGGLTNVVPTSGKKLAVAFVITKHAVNGTIMVRVSGVDELAYEPKNANIQSHIASTSNPHLVTKEQVGLGNVTNAAQMTTSHAANAITGLASTTTSLTSGGTGVQGTSTVVARQDHTHTLPAYPTTLPASDVHTWAKASVKPSYTWSEIGSKPTTFPPDSHTHSYLPLSGGSLTGALDSSSYYKSTIATGTAPYQCTSTTLNTNLNADLLDGYHGSSVATANTYALRNPSGDIVCRLFRSDYENQPTISGALAFRVNNSTDNYVRFCSDTTAIKTWLGALSTGGGTISGNLTITGTLTETSDRRLKTNIQPIRNATEKVQQLQGCTFKKHGSDARLTGVIAQDVQKVLPEAIVTDENGYLSVAYGNLVGLLIESIKELKNEIDELRGER